MADRANAAASDAPHDVMLALENIERLRKSAAMLQQSCEGYALEKFGQAQIGWLADTAAHVAAAHSAIETVRAALAATPPTESN